MAINKKNSVVWAQLWGNEAFPSHYLSFSIRWDWRLHFQDTCSTIMWHRYYALKGASNWIYAIFSCTFCNKIKLGTFFSIGNLEMKTYMIFFNKNFTTKFSDCLVFFVVNFFQGLLWEFSDISRQYPPVHILSWPFFSLLYPRSESLVKKQILLTGFELSRQFLFEITL